MKNLQLWSEQYFSSVEKKNFINIFILSFKFPIALFKDILSLIGVK
jgi:hypothetical protein